MEEVLVAPGQVLAYPGLIRVSIGAMEDVVIGVPSQVPVPDKWIETMTCTELVVLLHDVNHDLYWRDTCILEKLPVPSTCSLQIV